MSSDMMTFTVCVAVCCSVLQCVAVCGGVCCSVLQCVDMITFTVCHCEGLI